MTFVSGFLAVLLSTAATNAPNICSPFTGQIVATATFEAVHATLPRVEARGQYESATDYERRLAAAQPTGNVPVVIRRGGENQFLTYNADRQELTVNDMAFGAGVLNYGDISGLRSWRSSDDNFSNAIGFVVEEVETGRRTFEATNGFGARIPVESIEGRISAVWERPGRLNESPFQGVRPFRPVAILQMAPAEARDIIEAGGTAIMVVPRAPFIRTGRSDLAASFNRPRERLNTVTVLIADIQCAFLVNGQGRVVLALPVR